jgi:hypothetical protein
MNAARTTVGKDNIEKEPSSELKLKLLLSEHSPIRVLKFTYTFKNIKYWMSMHLSRHKIGVEHFIKTQRDDRTGVDRDNLPQSELVNHTISLNAQAIINISRKRLCNKTHEETKHAWVCFLRELSKAEDELVAVCVPECIYRNGICPEIECCGFIHTSEFKLLSKGYKNIFNPKNISKTN